MVKLLLAVSLLAAPASAQVRAVPASAWSAPIRAAGAAAGLPRVNAFGSSSLTSLLTPGMDETVAVFSNPKLLEPLAQELAARGVTPESFSALWLDAKLGVLSEAAKAVERQTASEVSALAGRALRSAADENELGAMEASLLAIGERAIYLRPGAFIAFAQTGERILELRRARTRALDAFYKDLPRILAEGAYRDGALLVETRGPEKTGWRGADGHPDEFHATLEGVIEPRVAAAESLPRGPWTSIQEAMIGGAVDRALRAGLLKTPDETARVLALRGRAIDAARFDGGPREERRALAAAPSPAEGRLGLARIEAIEAHYGRSLAMAREWRDKAAVLAGAWAGSEKFPSWRSLREQRRAIAARMKKIGTFDAPRWWIVAIPPLVAGMTGALDPAWPLWAILPLAAIVLAPVALMMWASRRAAAAEIPREFELHALMDKHFRGAAPTEKES